MSEGELNKVYQLYQLIEENEVEIYELNLTINLLKRRLTDYNIDKYYEGSAFDDPNKGIDYVFQLSENSSMYKLELYKAKNNRKFLFSTLNELMEGLE